MEEAKYAGDKPKHVCTERAACEVLVVVGMLLVVVAALECWGVCARIAHA